MSFRKLVAFEVSPEEVSKLLKALLGEPKKQTTHGFTHSALVSVKSGDGIGFDADDCVMVVNAKNNVGMLLKANYNEPFHVHKSLDISSTPVLSKQELIPGHTYLVTDDEQVAFIKYLGHSMVLVRAYDGMTITRIVTDKIPPHYEISVPSSNSK